jgi:hypothetical protein
VVALQYKLHLVAAVADASVLMRIQTDSTLYCKHFACTLQLDALFSAQGSSSSKQRQQQQHSSTADRAAALQARALHAVDLCTAAQTQATELQQALDTLQCMYEQEQSAKCGADVASEENVTRLQAQFAAAEQAAAERHAADTAAAVKAEVRVQLLVYLKCIIVLALEYCLLTASTQRIHCSHSRYAPNDPVAAFSTHALAAIVMHADQSSTACILKYQYCFIPLYRLIDTLMQ